MKSLEERIKFRQEQRDVQAKAKIIGTGGTPAETKSAGSTAASSTVAKTAKANKKSQSASPPDYSKLSLDELKGMLIDRGYQLEDNETIDDLIHTLTEDDKENAAAAAAAAASKPAAS